MLEPIIIIIHRIHPNKTCSIQQRSKLFYTPVKRAGSTEFSVLNSPLRLKPGPLVELNTCSQSVTVKEVL